MAKEKSMKGLKVWLLFIFLIVLSLNVSAISTTDNQAWVSLQDGEVSDFDLYGGVTGAEGVVNGTFEFDGATSYVSVPDTSLRFVKTDSFTINLDFNLGEDSDSTIFTSMSRTGTDTGHFGYYMLKNNVNELVAGCSNLGVSGTNLNAGTGYFDNNWHNVSFIYDNEYGYLYVDGILEDEGAMTNCGANPSNYYLDIGANSANGVSSVTTGKIDEVYIYDDATQTNLVFYASMDSLYDQSNNTNSLSAYNGVTYDSTTDSYDFDGADDYLEASGIPSQCGAGEDLTVSTWVNFDILGTTTQMIMDKRDANNDGLTFFRGVDNKLNFYNDLEHTTSTETVGINQWYNLVAVSNRNTNKVSLYIDGTEVNYDSQTTITTCSVTTNARIGIDSYDTSNALTGSISGVSIYNRTLSPTEISDLYAEGRDYTPYVVSANFTITAIDNSTSASLNTFNATVNGTFYNTTTGTITLPYLVNEGIVVNITVDAVNYLETEYLNYNTSTSLVAELDPEDLQDFALTTPSNTKTNQSYYNVTWTEAVSPTNKTVTYNVSVIFPNGTLKESFSTTDLIKELNLSDYTANTYTVRVNATENATGDSFQHNSSLYVDRTNYVYFYDASSTLALTSKNITVKFPDARSVSYLTDAEGKINFQSFYLTDLQNGSYNITYNGDQGYVTPITFTYATTTLPFNQSYNISRASLNVSVRDGATNALITENITISINGIGSFTRTNGSLFLVNQTFVSGEYTIYVSSENYTYNQKTFTYTNQEELSLTINLLELTETNLGTIYVNTYDTFLDIISGVDLRLQELNTATSSFEEVSQRISSSQGQSAFQVLLNEKVYRIYATYTLNGVTYEAYSLEEGEVFYADGQSVNIYLNTISGFTEDSLYGLDVTVSNKDLINDTSYHTVTFIDGTGNEHNVCLGYYYLNGVVETLLLEICSEASSGTINAVGGYLLNRSYTNIVKAYVKEGDYIKYYYEERYTSDNSFESNFEIIIGFLIMSLLLSGLAMSLHLNRIDYFTYISIFLGIIWLIVSPFFYTTGQLGFTIILGLAVLYLAKQRSNLENV